MGILAPSASGLQRLLNICEQFAKENDLIYNVNKSYVMCIKAKQCKYSKVPKLYLCNEILQYVNKYKYLGVYICDDFNDLQDIKRQLQAFYLKSNTLMRKFYMCNVETKKVLFNAYCTNFYGSCLWWTYPKYMLNKMRVAFNNGFRKFMNYDKFCSASNMFVNNNVNCFNVLRRQNMFKFIERINELSRNNVILESITRCSDLYETSYYKEFLDLLHSKKLY